MRGITRRITHRVNDSKLSLKLTVVTSSKHTSKLPDADHVVWHSHSITRQQREQNNRHRGTVVWLTGLPGSGKSTLAHALAEKLHQMS